MPRLKQDMGESAWGDWERVAPEEREEGSWSNEAVVAFEKTEQGEVSDEGFMQNMSLRNMPPPPTPSPRKTTYRAPNMFNQVFIGHFNASPPGRFIKSDQLGFFLVIGAAGWGRIFTTGLTKWGRTFSEFWR